MRNQLVTELCGRARRPPSSRHGNLSSMGGSQMYRWLSWLLAGLMGGCASVRSTLPLSQSGISSPAPQVAETASLASPVQIERGRPNRLLDGSGRILGVPRQLLLWDRRVNNHQISSKTEQSGAEYLSENDLPEVLVRVNQYAPLAEWSRLTTNRRIGAGWRYTVGALDMLLYTLIPGRLVGDDWYNPFTDTINLYSDVPAIALHEAAYAKDIHHRRCPGTYAVIQHLPLVGMWYRTNATRDALQYIEQRGGSAAELQEAERILYPLYGGAAGGQIGTFVPIPFVGYALTPAGAVVGHVVGRCRAHQDRPKGKEVEPRREGY